MNMFIILCVIIVLLGFKCVFYAISAEDNSWEIVAYIIHLVSLVLNIVLISLFANSASIKKVERNDDENSCTTSSVNIPLSTNNVIVDTDTLVPNCNCTCDCDNTNMRCNCECNCNDPYTIDNFNSNEIENKYKDLISDDDILILVIFTAVTFTFYIVWQLCFFIYFLRNSYGEDSYV
jgi:hypothetical protein